MGIEIDISTNETMKPVGIDWERAPEKRDGSAIGGPSDEDETSGGMSLKIERPWIGKGVARRGLTNTNGVTATPCQDIGGGSLLERGDRIVLESGPDFVLPKPVETLDRILKAWLAGWSENRNNVKAQAEPHHASNDVTVLVGPLKQSVVVELSIVGQSPTTPVADRKRGDDFGCHLLPRPGVRQTTVNRDYVQHFNIDPPTNDEPGDHVEGIDLCAARDHLGQIPAGRRRWTSNSSAPIDRTRAEEDSRDGSGRGDCRRTLTTELLANGKITELTERAEVPEFFSDRQDQRFGRLEDTVCWPGWPSRTIGEIDSVESAGSGAGNPSLNSFQTDLKLPGDTPQRAAPANGCDHESTTTFDRSFFDTLSLSANVSITIRSHPQEVAEKSWKSRHFHKEKRSKKERKKA